MRAPRVFAEQPLVSGESVALDARASRHLAQVLRLRPGDPVILFNGDGRDLTASIRSCRRDGCVANLGQVLRTEAAPLLELGLGIGISRGERMDMAIQKAVELGVAEITPLATRRSVVRLNTERLERRQQHWRGIVIGACEQSGRSRLPKLGPVSDLPGWLEGRENGLLLHHAAGHSLADLPSPGHGLDLLVGPEGGLDESERQAASRVGFTAVRLGPRVLRTETAPLAALAAIQTLWGDFR